MLDVNFHNDKNLGSTPWLDCKRKFYILSLLKRFKWPYLNVFNQFESIIADEMFCMQRSVFCIKNTHLRGTSSFCQLKLPKLAQDLVSVWKSIVSNNIFGYFSKVPWLFQFFRFSLTKILFPDFSRFSAFPDLGQPWLCVHWPHLD